LFDGETVKIADFGLVKAVGTEWMETQIQNKVINPNEEKTLIDSSADGSRQRALMGTYSYMSPEQKKGVSADARSDLDAVGLIAFRILTGEESPGMERASEMDLGLDKEWDSWLVKALKNRPDDRYQSSEEMRDAISL
jgi:serine/threonine protein kinase